MNIIDDRIDLSGVRTRVYADDEDGKIHVRYDQDLEPYLEYATRLRNDDAYTKNGIKKGWMHAIHISDVHIIQLKGIGIDIVSAPLKDIVAGIKKLGIEHACMTTRARV
jgi:hypothetical protein